MAHPIRPGSEPVSFPGDRRGALVLHGFTGAPPSVLPVATALARAGFTVEVPLLPGHGTHVEDMAGIGFADWVDAASSSFEKLRARCDSVVVAGLSMGGAVGLALASSGIDLHGLAVINAPAVQPAEAMLQMIREQIESGNELFPAIQNDIAAPGVEEYGYDSVPLRSLMSLLDALPGVRAGLPQITCPTLVVHSVQDHVVDPATADVIAAELGGPVERLVCERGYHVVTLDFDGPLVCDTVVDFATRVSESVSVD